MNFRSPESNNTTLGLAFFISIFHIFKFYFLIIFFLILQVLVHDGFKVSFVFIGCLMGFFNDLSPQIVL